MPMFGLQNAAQAFQRLMDTVCNGLDFVFIYLDDILVSSASVDQHKDHMRRVFERLALHGLVINVNKCQFGTDSIDYLDHHITSQGAVPLPDKVDAIRKFTRPTTVKGLQQFAGMINFYHRFVPKAAHIMRHIYNALAGKPTALEWSSDIEQAFTNANLRIAFRTHFNISVIRLVLEHACPVWHTNLPNYLSDSIELIQNRAFKSIFPGKIYNDIPNDTGLSTLRDKREVLCMKYFTKIQGRSHKLNCLIPELRNIDDDLRPGFNRYPLTSNRTNRYGNSLIPTLAIGSVRPFLIR